MGFLDKIKAMFGWHAAAVEFVLPSETFQLGQPIEGRVGLIAGGAEQHVTALTVQVIRRVSQAVNPEEGTTPEEIGDAGAVPEAGAGLDTAEGFPVDEVGEEEVATEDITVAEATLAENLTLRRGDRTAFDFSIDLGDAAEPSGESVRWLLCARADIPAAVDAMAWEPIEVREGSA